MTESQKLTQTDFGRAFEWAVGYSLSNLTSAPIIESNFSKIAKTSYGKINDKTKNSFIKAADIAISHILEKEKSLNSKTVTFNRGYSINFRIHSASSKVESSLKFDVNAIGLPVNEIYQQTFDIAK